MLVSEFSASMGVGNATTRGQAQPCLVVAEAGVNHNGQPDVAHALVDAAATSGADAVKFQTFLPDAVAAANALRAPYQRPEAGSQLALLSDLVLPISTWRELAAHAQERHLVFLSTAFDPGSLELVLDLGVPAVKIPSGEITNLPFLRLCASAGLPVILSTGMATLEEVRQAIDQLGDAPSICVLHCVTAYPAPSESSNLMAMVTMRDSFGLPVGWSDHTEGVVTALGAVALGAMLLEKHLTLDRSMTGPDHRASTDVAGFTQYMSTVRALEAALGDGAKVPSPVELENRVHVRRSLHAARSLPEGYRLQAGDTIALRPATGLPPGIDTSGLVTSRSIARGEPISPSDVTGAASSSARS